MSRVRFTAVFVAACLLVAAATPSVAGAPPGNLVRVKGIGPDTVISLLPSEGGGRVPLDLMARLLGGGLDSIGGGHWRFTLYGTTLDVHEGIAFVGYNGFVLPLLEPTRVEHGVPQVTLQLFSEIIPRFAIGVLWDRSRAEVRLFQGIARAQNPVPSPTNGAPTTPTTTVASTPRPATPPTATPQPTTPPSTTPQPPAPQPPATRPAPATAPAPSSPNSPLTPATVGAPAGLSRRYVVAVDAGHGGADPGNPGVIINGRRVNESRLTLAISLEVEKALRAKDIGVVMTRRTDSLVARDDRGPIANSRKADLFVSIHTNAANPAWRNGAAVRGYETYFLSTARTEDEARVASMENDVVRFEAESGAEKGDPLSYILNDLAQNEHLRESADLANVVQAHLRGSHPGPDRGVKQAGFAVLARAYMPAVLVEVGFGTNAAEARWMASPVGQRAIAAEIADAIHEYLQHYERRMRMTGR